MSCTSLRCEDDDGSSDKGRGRRNEHRNDAEERTTKKLTRMPTKKTSSDTPERDGIDYDYRQRREDAASNILPPTQHGCYLFESQYGRPCLDWVEGRSDTFLLRDKQAPSSDTTKADGWCASNEG